MKIIERRRTNVETITLERDSKERLIDLYFVNLYYDDSSKVRDMTMETEYGTIFEDEEEFKEIENFLKEKKII